MVTQKEKSFVALLGWSAVKIKQISTLSSTTLPKLSPVGQNQIINMTLMDTSDIILMMQARERGGRGNG